MLSLLAKELEVFIIGGSIPEEDGGKYFNTCTVFSPSGEMVAKHRKVTMYFFYLRLAIYLFVVIAFVFLLWSSRSLNVFID